MKLLQNGLDWSLEHQGKILLRSGSDFPMLFTGCGRETVDMYRGNFKIDDYVIAATGAPGSSSAMLCAWN